MIKVLILTEGGRKIGYGHMSRCLALAGAFKEIKPDIKVKFVVRLDKWAKEFLRSNSINFINLDWVKKPDTIQALIDKETIIVVDSYCAPKSFYKRLQGSKYKPYIVAVDDYNRICYKADTVINPTVRDKHSIIYPSKDGIRYLIGTEYVILGKGFIKNSDKKIHKKIKNVLISLGGADCTKLVVDIANFLAKYGFRIHIVSPYKKSYKFLKRAQFNLYSNLNPKDLRSLMQKADLCISGGGQTLNELAYLGVPTIGICLAKNQIGNIKRWKEIGFLEYIGGYQDKNIFENLKISLKILDDIKIRRKKSEIGRNAIDGNGSLRIVKASLSHFYEKNLTLRKADSKDAPDIYNLSNDPLVRRNSFNTKPIEWQHHLNWLREKLADNNCVYFVADIFNRPFGQVRFDMNPKRKGAVINISLDKNIRGLGLSSLIISKSVNALFKMRRDVERVYAFIKPENITSLKAFGKANFKFLKDTKVKENKAKLYIHLKNNNV